MTKAFKNRLLEELVTCNRVNFRRGGWFAITFNLITCEGKVKETGVGKDRSAIIIIGQNFKSWEEVCHWNRILRVIPLDELLLDLLIVDCVVECKSEQLHSDHEGCEDGEYDGAAPAYTGAEATVSAVIEQDLCSKLVFWLEPGLARHTCLVCSVLLSNLVYLKELL